MNALNRSLATIQVYLGKLSVSQKLLIGSLVVIMFMVLFMVQQYAKSPSDVALLEPGASPERQSRAVQFLQASAVPHRVDSATGEIMVPSERRYTLLAQMAQQGQLSGDNHLLFDSLINKASWTQTYQQSQQMETIAVQNELARIISQMNGIRSASVIMDVPKARGLGQPRSTPTASVTVFSERGVNQDTVDAVAHLVASSRAGLEPQHVRVIDGTTNRQSTPRDEKSLITASYQEFQSSVEDRKQRHLYEMLSSYIKGVVVTVHAQVDVTRKQVTTESVLPSGKGSETLVKSETNTEKKAGSPRAGGEPGVASNTGADISAPASSGAMSTNDTEAKTEYEGKFGKKTEIVDDPRGFATKINAVVNIPRGYFVEIWKQQQASAGSAAPAAAGGAPAGGAAAAAGEPKDADLKPIIDAETTRIKKEVALQIDTSAADRTFPGEVEVSMIPTMIPLEPQQPQKAGLFDFGGGSGGSGGVLAMNDMVKTLGVGAMAMLALGLVVMTAFKANRQDKLPTAAELVGVPPTLPGEGDIVGEAGEADSVLSGIELSDDDIKERKILEQVGAVVKERPKDAAAILSRWMAES